MWNPLRARREREAAHLVEREAFRAARRLAREDVLVLGEQVAALEVPRDADRHLRDHHHSALDGYDAAQRLLDAADSVADVEALDETLQRARWDLAAVRALAAGEPLPERRGPCFFNPQHGPAVTTLDWTPRGGTTRTIEVCRNDELRLETGADPEHREIRVGDRVVPWWQASASGAPWTAETSTRQHHGALVEAAMAEARLRSGLGQIGIQNPPI